MLSKFYRHWYNSFIGIPRQVWLLAAVGLVNRIGAMVIPFLSIYVNRELGYSVDQSGFILAGFGVGALIGAFLGGKLTDRIGYYPVQFWSLVCNGAILLVLMTLRDFYAVCAGVFLMSFSSEIFRPANSVAMARFCTPENRTRSISLYRMSMNLGWTLAPALGGILVSLLGWNSLFWIDGLTCIAAAAALRILLPEQKETARHADLPPVEDAAPALYLSPYRDRRYLFFMVLTMFGAITFMQLLWTIPMFWRNVFEWPEYKIGIITALNGVLVFLVEMPLVFAIEKRFRILSFIQFGLILYALSYFSLLLPIGQLAVALLYVLFISFGEMFVMPYSSNFVYARSEGPQQGQYMALYTMSYSVANIVAPVFGTQMIARFGYPALWNTVAASALFVWAGVWWMGKTEKEEKRLHRA